MANIGSFKKVGSDFQGEIVTLSLQTKGVRIVARDQPLQRQRPQPPGLRGPGRDRGRLVEALQRGPRLSLAQARRSELQRADLRQPLRRRGRRGLHPHLVAPQQAQRRLSRPCNAPPGPRAGLSPRTRARAGSAISGSPCRRIYASAAPRRLFGAASRHAAPLRREIPPTSAERLAACQPSKRDVLLSASMLLTWARSTPMRSATASWLSRQQR